MFAQCARQLQSAARASGLVVPAFRSPPRRRDADRTIRRLPGGAVVAVRLAGRQAAQIQRDMIDGVLAANDLDGRAAERMRQVLLRSLAELDPVDGGPRATRHAA